MKNAKLFLEIADTADKRSEGLMFREKLACNTGMLFDFPQSIKLSFWMKNTPIPLDIAFLDDDFRIAEIKHMAPNSTKSTRSTSSHRYALEVNSGWFEKNGIGVGSRLRTAKKRVSVEEDLPPQNNVPEMPPEVPPVPDQAPEQGIPPQPAPPKPEVVVNMSFREAVSMANDNELAIAFDYEYPEGNVNSYILIPSGDYEIKMGRSEELVCGRCVHSGGEYRNFIINNVIGYDLYRYGGDSAGQRVEIPAPTVISPEISIETAFSEANVKLSAADVGLMKESQSYSDGGQLMMTEYWDDIKRKKGKGKTEGQAILDYLAENSKRNSPEKTKKRKKKKK